MRISLLSLAATLVGAALAADPICDSECQKGCDRKCQQQLQNVFDNESKLWVGDITSDPFYSTPANFTGAKVGDVLRWHDVPFAQTSTNWTIPAGLSLSRLMYVTEDVDGAPIPATAWVLLPFGTTLKTPGEPGKLRTIVWAHGTAGRGRLCAPTNNKGLYYEWKAPFALATAGHAVIAPDYSGQGSDIPQGFMYEAGYPHAADVAFSLIAARKVIGDVLSKKWVVYGHSEGGLTAWRTAERLAMPNQEALLAAGDFIGSVAAAPALRPQKLVPLSWESGTAGAPYSVYWLQTLVSLYPDQLKIEDYLTDVGMQRLKVLDRSCYLTGFAAIGRLTPDEVFKNKSFINHPATNDWAARYNGQGPHPLASPMLVVQGAADVVTPAVLTMTDFNLTCKAYPNVAAHAKLYPELGHELLDAAQLDVLTWINERFKGVPAAQGCSIEHADALTDRYARGELVWSGRSQ